MKDTYYSFSSKSSNSSGHGGPVLDKLNYSATAFVCCPTLCLLFAATTTGTIIYGSSNCHSLNN